MDPIVHVFSRRYLKSKWLIHDSSGLCVGSVVRKEEMVSLDNWACFYNQKLSQLNVWKGTGLPARLEFYPSSPHYPPPLIFSYLCFCFIFSSFSFQGILQTCLLIARLFFYQRVMLPCVSTSPSEC